MLNVTQKAYFLWPKNNLTHAKCFQKKYLTYSASVYYAVRRLQYLAKMPLQMLINEEFLKNFIAVN